MSVRSGAVILALISAACGSAAAAPAANVQPAPLPSASEIASRELTPDEQVRQALDRLTFGPRPGDDAAVRAIGVDRWIATQLEPERIDDRATDSLVAHMPTLGMDAAELVQRFPPPALIRLQQRRRATPLDGRSDGSSADSLRVRAAAGASRRVLTDLQVAHVVRAEASERQLQEVMVDFWENHFNVFAGKGPERYLLIPYDRDVIRPHALGKFRDLLEAVAKSPAMLFYLDNWESSVERGRPRLPTPRARRARPGSAARTTERGLNENYARELMELHTLGADGGFTQHDVVEVARAFTGWSVQAPRRGGGFVFRASMHDAGAKVVLGHTLPAGRGIDDGEQVLDILARHPSTAHFIATKLVRHFVSDSTPPALVDRVAATFTNTDGDIRECLRTIFTSREFFSRAAYRAKVKSPFELVVSAMRVVDAEPDTTPRTVRMIAQLGEPIFGHQAPNGYPDVASAWMSAGAVLERINFARAVAEGRLPGAPRTDSASRVELALAAPDFQQR